MKTELEQELGKLQGLFESLERLEELEKVIREIRVLRYTSPDDDLKGFRIHLFESEWDRVEKLLNR